MRRTMKCVVLAEDPVVRPGGSRRGQVLTCLGMLGVALALCSAIGVFAQTADCSIAQPGCPDPTFGGTGIVTTPSLLGNIGQIAVQTIAGEERIVGLKTTPGNWVMVRYRANGQLDTSFGTAGVYTRSFSSGYPQAYGVLAQRDNKLLVLSSQPSDVKGWSKIVVTRLLPNATSVTPGPYDTTFGNGGEVSLGLYYTMQRGMVLQSDGKIVVVSERSHNTFVLHRLLPSGALDPDFGTGGVAELASSDALYLRGIVIEPVENADGVLEERIVVSSGVNTTGSTGGPYLVRLRRFMPDGTPDATFGNAGSTDMQVRDASETAFWHLAADASGRIVSVGSYCVRTSSGALDYYVLAARYTVDGQLDPDFANGGIYRQDGLGDDHQMRSVAVHPDGRILIAGWRGTGDYNTMSLVVWRLLDNGGPDPSFGTNGMMTTSAMAGGNGTVAGPAFVRGGTAFAVGGRAFVKVGQKGKTPIMANVFAAGRFLY